MLGRGRFESALRGAFVRCMLCCSPMVGLVVSGCCLASLSRLIAAVAAFLLLLLPPLLTVTAEAVEATAAADRQSLPSHHRRPHFDDYRRPHFLRVRVDEKINTNNNKSSSSVIVALQQWHPSAETISAIRRTRAMPKSPSATMMPAKKRTSAERRRTTATTNVQRKMTATTNVQRKMTATTNVQRKMTATATTTRSSSAVLMTNASRSGLELASARARQRRQQQEEETPMAVGIRAVLATSSDSKQKRQAIKNPGRTKKRVRRDASPGMLCPGSARWESALDGTFRCVRGGPGDGNVRPMPEQELQQQLRALQQWQEAQRQQAAQMQQYQAKDEQQQQQLRWLRGIVQQQQQQPQLRKELQEQVNRDKRLPLANAKIAVQEQQQRLPKQKQQLQKSQPIAWPAAQGEPYVLPQLQPQMWPYQDPSAMFRPRAGFKQQRSFMQQQPVWIPEGNFQQQEFFRPQQLMKRGSFQQQSLPLDAPGRMGEVMMQPQAVPNGFPQLDSNSRSASAPVADSLARQQRRIVKSKQKQRQRQQQMQQQLQEAQREEQAKIDEVAVGRIQQRPWMAPAAIGYNPAVGSQYRQPRDDVGAPAQDPIPAPASRSSGSKSGPLRVYEGKPLQESLAEDSWAPKEAAAPAARARRVHRRLTGEEEHQPQEVESGGNRHHERREDEKRAQQQEEAAEQEERKAELDGEQGDSLLPAAEGNNVGVQEAEQDAAVAGNGAELGEPEQQESIAKTLIQRSTASSFFPLNFYMHSLGLLTAVFVGSKFLVPAK